MTDLRIAAQQALEALEMSRRFVYADNRPQCDGAIDALRAALAQQDEPQTIDEAMRLPRAMAQAYENGYKAGEAHERERCLRLIDDHVRAVDSEDVVRAIKEVQG